MQLPRDDEAMRRAPEVHPAELAECSCPQGLLGPPETREYQREGLLSDYPPLEVLFRSEEPLDGSRRAYSVPRIDIVLEQEESVRAFEEILVKYMVHLGEPSDGVPSDSHCPGELVVVQS